MQVAADENREAHVFIQLKGRNRAVASGQAQDAAQSCFFIVGGLRPAVVQTLLLQRLPKPRRF
ncbi:hypothetical protein D9M71_717160 [compost metagenome]